MNSHPQPATYYGHRQRSYFAVDTGELVELRARQRTFDNAYLRTCLGNLGYSAVILKLFDSRFYNSKHSASPRINQHFRSDLWSSRPALCYSCSTTVGHCLYTTSSLQSGFLRPGTSCSGDPPPSARLCSCLGSTIHNSRVDRRSGHSNCGFCPDCPSRSASSALNHHTKAIPPKLPAILGSWDLELEQIF